MHYAQESITEPTKYIQGYINIHDIAEVQQVEDSNTDDAVIIKKDGYKIRPDESFSLIMNEIIRAQRCTICKNRQNCNMAARYAPCDPLETEG